MLAHPCTISFRDELPSNAFTSRVLLVACLKLLSICMGPLQMTEKLNNYNLTAYLKNSEDLKVLFDDVLKTGDANFIVNFLRMAVRARGVALVSKKIKEKPDPMPDFLLGEEDPSFKTVLSVIQALEIELGIRSDVPT